MKIKNSIIGVVLLATITISPAMSPRSQRIAEDTRTVGKWGMSTCLVFAEEKTQELRKAGYEAHVVVFSWSRGNQGGNHACVLYFDKNWYVIDATMEKARQVVSVSKDETALVKQAYPDVEKIHILEVR